MSTSSIITTHDTKPHDELDRERVFQLMANALIGVNGVGDWDGGLEGDGWWVKRGYWWEAVLTADVTGDFTLELPFEANNTVVEVVNNNTQYLYSIYSGSTLSVTGLSGKVHIFIRPTRNKKG
jgi:hypothetical protein